MFIKEQLRQRKTKLVLPARVEGNWFALQRLRFIEERLFWAGRINRADIVGRFGVHISNASKDLTDYQALAPRNALYDATAKTYRAGPRFVPIFDLPTFEKLFGHLLLDDQTPAARSLFEWVRSPARHADPVVVRNVIEAAANGLAIKVFYLSLRSPQGQWRWIEPHSVAFDGQRWHARAWCQLRSEFRDFNLGRVTHVEGSAVADADHSNDVQWHHIIDVGIQPHSDLSPEQKTLVERDYSMMDGRLIISCRQALLGYLLNNLGLDHNLAPPRQLVELVDPAIRALSQWSRG